VNCQIGNYTLKMTYSDVNITNIKNDATITNIKNDAIPKDTYEKNHAKKDEDKFLIPDDTHINMDIQKEFFEACKIGDLDKVKSLLFNEKVNPADRDNLAIRWASENGHYNIVKLLLEDKRINPADDNNLVILWASKNRHFNVIKLLLRNNRVINSFNIDNINYIKHYSSKKIINFYKNYFNLYKIYDIFLLININLWLCCNTTIKLSINYKLPIQLKDFILHHYVYNYRQNL